MTYHQERQLREALVAVCRCMWQKGFISATDGNVSLRLDSRRLLTTPSGRSKGFLSPEDLVVTDMEGRVQGGRYPVTTEILMHLAAYQERPAIQSVVHAHPPLAVAFSIAGEEVPADLMPEVVLHFRRIPLVPYATPGTREAGDAIRPYIRLYDAIMMDRHGSVTVGADVWDAYYKLEKLEQAAQIAMTARLLGKVQTLSPDQIQALMAAHAAPQDSSRW